MDVRETGADRRSSRIYRRRSCEPPPVGFAVVLLVLFGLSCGGLDTQKVELWLLSEAEVALPLPPAVIRVAAAPSQPSIQLLVNPCARAPVEFSVGPPRNSGYCNQSHPLGTRLGRSGRVRYTLEELGGGSGGTEYFAVGCWEFHGQTRPLHCRWQEELVFGKSPQPPCLAWLRGARAPGEVSPPQRTLQSVDPVAFCLDRRIELSGSEAPDSRLGETAGSE